MGYLVLADGSIFKGNLIGAKTDSVGELVFNTNMTGYQEVLVDPANYGQIIVMAYPLIGNYGINKEDMALLQPYPSAIVVREICDIPSNWRATSNLEDYLVEHNITGISGVDTREIVKIIREKGNMHAKICTELPKPQEMNLFVESRIKDAVAKVTCKAPYSLGSGNISLAVIDYGLNQNIIQSLLRLGTKLDIYPAWVTARTIMQGNYSGVVLSSGPGNPKDCADEIKTIKELVGNLPLFGIGLGHQLLALACGGDTYKLKCGHGGAQSVKELSSGKLYITSQNHNYNISSDCLPFDAKVSFVNLNDQTIEGLKYSNGNFSVQFYPSGGAGPNDADFLFERFIRIVDKK